MASPIVEYNVTDLSDETPTVFNLEAYKLVPLIACLLIMLIVSITSKCTIIHYIIVYAPSRPINTMVLDIRHRSENGEKIGVELFFTL